MRRGFRCGAGGLSGMGRVGTFSRSSKDGVMEWERALRSRWRTYRSRCRPHANSSSALSLSSATTPASACAAPPPPLPAAMAPAADLAAVATALDRLVSRIFDRSSNKWTISSHSDGPMVWS